MYFIDNFWHLYYIKRENKEEEKLYFMINHLFTQKDIELYGFTYEPNAVKCKTVQLRIIPFDFYNKKIVANKIHFQNVHSVYHINGVAYVRGHGNIVSL
jgi:hypothetical protein